MGQLVEGEHKTEMVAGYVEPTVHRQLVALAREQERTVSFVVRRALLRELERVHNEEEAMSNNVYDEARDGPMTFASVPEGRRLDPGTRPKGYGSVGPLRPYTQELGNLLRRELARDRRLPTWSRTARFYGTHATAASTRSSARSWTASTRRTPEVEAFAVRDRMVVLPSPTRCGQADTGAWSLARSEGGRSG